MAFLFNFADNQNNRAYQFLNYLCSSSSSAASACGHFGASNSKMVIRRAAHSGSWYEPDSRLLDSQLSKWLSDARCSDVSHGPARAIIAPHAGFSYSAATSAYAYSQIDPARVKRVFILGPSHHVYIDGCALTKCDEYATPLYNIPVDKAVYSELKQSGVEFSSLQPRQDEDEHSIEMHLPFLAKVMQNYSNQFTVVPIVVGHLSSKHESAYGCLLARYLRDSQNLFIISSDFCHWGRRFSFTPVDKSFAKIYKGIESMDQEGMQIIEAMDTQGFHDYLKRTGNTICGRNPIILLLSAIDALKPHSNGFRFSLKFLKYAQSNSVQSIHDSSVSYAAASFVFGN